MTHVRSIIYSIGFSIPLMALNIMGAADPEEVSRNLIRMSAHGMLGEPLSSTAEALKHARDLYDHYNNYQPSMTETRTLLQEAHTVASAMAWLPIQDSNHGIEYAVAKHFKNSAALNDDETLLALIPEDCLGAVIILNLNTGNISNSDPILPTKSIDFGVGNRLFIASMFSLSLLQQKEGKFCIEKINYSDHEAGVITEVIAHKRLEFFALIMNKYNTSSISIRDYDYNECRCYKVSGILEKTMVKWHPTDPIIAIHSPTSLCIHDIRLGRMIKEFTHIAPNSHFDFNETGSRICCIKTHNTLINFSITCPDNNCTDGCTISIGLETVLPGSFVHNVHGDTFAYRHVEHTGLVVAQYEPACFLRTKDSDIITGTLWGTRVFTTLPEAALIIPRKQYGQLLTIHRPNNTDTVVSLRSPRKMLGTNIGSDIRRHNLPVFYALALARNTEQVLELKKPAYKTVVADTAQKDPIFAATLASWHTD